MESTAELVEILKNPDYVNYEQADILIADGADINYIDENGETFLFHAVKTGDLELVEYVVNNGCEVNVLNNEGKSATLIAIQNGRMDIAGFLAVNGADIDNLSEEVDSEIPVSEQLYHLINSSFSEIDYGKATQLIHRGADINYLDRRGQTYLFYAIELRDITLLEFLINHGCNINKRDYSGTTPLLQTMENHDIQIAEFLVDKGANINIPNNHGITPFIHSMNPVFPLELFNFFIEIGANVNYRDVEGLTPLMHAFYIGSINVLSLTSSLINAGADTSAVSAHNQTILMIAVENVISNRELVEVIRLLINSETSVDVNAVDNGGRNVLFYIVNRSGTDKDIFELLKIVIDLRDVDLSLRDNSGIDIIQYLINNNRTAVAKILYTKLLLGERGLRINPDYDFMSDLNDYFGDGGRKKKTRRLGKKKTRRLGKKKTKSRH